MPHDYKIIFQQRAEKEIARLPLSVKNRVLDRIERLKVDPKPHGSVKMSGYENLYRIRIGDYRVIYEIQEGNRIVVIIIVAHRRDVYRGL